MHKHGKSLFEIENGEKKIYKKGIICPDYEHQIFDLRAAEILEVRWNFLGELHSFYLSIYYYSTF
jgi:hypothetical protein